jgi:hypothetical protein
MKKPPRFPKAPNDDIETAIQKDIAAKILVAMNPFKVARAEFTEWYVGTIGIEPEWTQPPVNWMFNAWIAAQGEREWLTQEEIDKRELQRAKMEVVTEKRRAVAVKREVDKKAAAAERKRVSNE